MGGPGTASYKEKSDSSGKMVYILIGAIVLALAVVGVLYFTVMRKSESSGPGGKVDLGALHVSKDVALFELKKPGNCKVGSMSEILFYTHVIRDIQRRTFDYVDREMGDNEREIRKSKRVQGYILADRLHPLLKNKDLFEHLNKVFASRNGRFDFIRYHEDGGTIKCQKPFCA